MRGEGLSRTWSRDWRIFLQRDTHSQHEIKIRRVSETGGLEDEGREQLPGPPGLQTCVSNFKKILKNPCRFEKEG